MQHHHKVYKGRAHTKKQTHAPKAKLSSSEKQKRIANKKFIKLFPNWKICLLKKKTSPLPLGEDLGGGRKNIYQHTLSIIIKKRAV
jgi:hypothetical protein